MQYLITIQCGDSVWKPSLSIFLSSVKQQSVYNICYNISSMIKANFAMKNWNTSVFHMHCCITNIVSNGPEWIFFLLRITKSEVVSKNEMLLYSGIVSKSKPLFYIFLWYLSVHKGYKQVKIYVNCSWCWREQGQTELSFCETGLCKHMDSSYWHLCWNDKSAISFLGLIFIKYLFKRVYTAWG